MTTNGSSIPPPPPPPPPPTPIPFSPLLSLPSNAKSAAVENRPSMNDLFAEIRARGNSKPLQSRRTFQRIETGADPKLQLSKELAAAAAKRAAKTLNFVEPARKQLSIDEPPRGLFADIRTAKGKSPKRTSKGDDEKPKVTRYKVKGLKCGEYQEDPRIPVDNVEVFADLDECERTRKYNAAREAILNTVLKYGNEVNEAESRRDKVLTQLQRERERLRKAEENGDVENRQNYMKSVSNYELELKVAQDKRDASKAKLDANWDFFNNYIMLPLSKRPQKDTHEFYLHLKRQKPVAENWTVDFVAQEFANYFKIDLPGYEVGGVSGLTSAQVKQVLLNSPLRIHLTKEILSQIMGALGVQVDAGVMEEDDHETILADEEQYYDAPMGPVQQSLYDKSQPRLWKSEGDIDTGRKGPVEDWLRSLNNIGIQSGGDQSHIATSRKIPNAFKQYLKGSSCGCNSKGRTSVSAFNAAGKPAVVIRGGDASEEKASIEMVLG